MIKTKNFYSDDLNQIKLDLLKQKAAQLRDFKNQISKTVCSNICTYIHLSKFEWINLFRTRLSFCNNQDISHAISDVYVTYQNKFDTFNDKIKFQVQKSLNITYYKRNGKNYKKGDVKNFEVELKQTTQTKYLTYLTKFWNEGLIEWLSNQTEQRYIDCYNYYLKNKNKVDILIQLRRNRILKQITRYPINFRSLSFNGTNELKSDLVNRNKNESSMFGVIITLGAQKTDSGKLYIPVKYDQDYHGNVENYNLSQNNKGQKIISYNISFPFQKKNRIRITLTKEEPDIEPMKYKTNYYGLDINIKHNLFVDKEGFKIDYDRKMFSDYLNFLKQQDEKKSRKTSNKLSNKDLIKHKKWQIRMNNMFIQKCLELILHCKDIGKDHIVLEDLSCFGKSFIKSEEFEGFKYSRLTRLLHLADLKNIITRLATKHDIQVTFIQSHYTSQLCPKCGHISKGNRKSQEEFICEECGYECNADVNAAGNIEFRMVSDVLKSKLLICKDGIYSTKKLSKFQIANILYDSYSKEIR